MTRARTVFTLVTCCGIAALGGCQTNQASRDTKPVAKTVQAPTGQPEMQLPPGWSEADMQACMVAGTPGEMQAILAKGAGRWQGDCTMWMGPGTEPMPKSPGSCVSTMVMDGRYLKTEVAGDMPGMGPFMGTGYSGYDNVSGKFVAFWLDNHSTGFMNGTGELSKDGKTMTWNFSYNCPITKKPTIMREIDTWPNDHTMIMDMFATDPKSGKEYKCNAHGVQEGGRRLRERRRSVDAVSFGDSH